ncbi:MAG: hypothetical protein Ta2E_12130 [Mycoplasmoidaceae bacterium]|nr:MAG: hypothetical protein Ta2E_12130 [Mycoplasmoidaceae bacterium]
MDNNITAQRYISNYVVKHPEEFEQENKDIDNPDTQIDYDPDFKDYILNALKNQKLKLWQS